MSDSEFEDFGQQIADACEAFLLGLQAIASEDDGGAAVPLLLLEVSQLLLAGARLGAQQDFEPETQYQPDVGPDPDLDRMRMRLADKLGDLDTYAHNIEPYDPDTVPSLISDDLTLVATDVANGLRHFRAGNVEEALWWWQFSYLASWGNNAIGVLSALHSIVAHSRLDRDVEGEEEQIEAAVAVLDVAGDPLAP
ncbi:DUF5063 domain-containing protein [Nocardioides pocheonensis]|uniref:DUF5063 domain-containing protein n=1 Tax=Nocardioides pocheonensis TaxID=661485 RepID=A0A3N0GR70_9ACTN|nr:DUF5063 domain-containing protein [Nocardioides pocheonensis]RNM14642.1 DUF5063 domain-containing protein [Nocardioides pocheonensis]